MDPLSITAGAAGFVSLGLTVSGGLIRYCKVYRTQGTDLTQLAQHAQELESFLNLINARTSGPQRPSTDIDGSLQKCRDACDACLLDFKQLSTKYIQPQPSSDLRQRGRRLARRLKYPFDKDEFDHLRSQLRAFNIELLGYLQLINLDLTRALRSDAASESTKIVQAVESTRIQLESFISSTEQVVTATLRDEAVLLKSSFQQCVGNTEKSITASMNDGLGVLSGQVALLGESQNSQTVLIKNHVDQALQLQLKQMQNFFSQTHEFGCTSYNNPTSIRESTPRRTLRGHKSPQVVTSTIIDSLCDCPPMRRTGLFPQHKQGCIFTLSNRKRWSFTTSFRVFNRQITGKLKVDYSQLVGWRDMRIHRNLTLRAIVPDDAPAFRALRLIVEKTWFTSRHDLERHFRSILIELNQIFSSGNGWPTDVTQDGRNLLCLFTRSLYFFSTDVEKMAVAVQFLPALVLMGVPVDASDFVGGSALGILLQTPVNDGYCDGLSLLIGKFLDLELPVPSPSYHNTAWILRLRIPELYESLGYTELCHAVLHRNECEVIRLLRSGHSVITERGINGLTLLHLSANWPRGLEILVEHAGEGIASLINIRNEYQQLALDYAIEVKEADSVELLLSAGSRVVPDLPYFIFQMEDRARAEAIACTMAETAARHDRALLRLALPKLPIGVIERLGLQEGVLLDSKAFDVAEALMRQGISLPLVYDGILPGSVYHPFRGCHPLITHNYRLYSPSEVLEMICWFEDHGADLYAPFPISHEYFDAADMRPAYPTIHFLMHELGINASDRFRAIKVSKQSMHQLSRLLEDSDIPGLWCTIASKFSLGCSNHLASDVRRCLSIGNNPYTDKELVDQAASEDHSYEMASDVIRVVTFSMLGMKHTCCDYSHRLTWSTEYSRLILMDPKEVDEVREEDRHLAALLETLMKEFNAKFRELKIPLSQFMEIYWWTRMEEVEKEQEESSAEDLHAIMEIGVKLPGA
ncbi:hypothetical protein GGR53DRAFT_522872 [Hypoxylon sp. FL1150]|nr:hypothetical protein GGR53DRAFT_522872 [Hypoxylon sp. FL1150]